MTRTFTQSEALWKRAETVIPGGSQTLSKTPKMFVPGHYPKFLERGDGCTVWDVDGHRYTDYILGLASITLGYNHPAVTEAVCRQMRDGSIFSLPHRLETEVAEQLCEIIPCAEQVRFLKTGAEANRAAIEIAKAATGRDEVLSCGYHGWHVEQYLPTFDYNDLTSFSALVKSYRGRLAAVILEPTLVMPPYRGFLENVCEQTREAGALVIFDELVTGFRWALGGAQEYYGLTPDLAVFGKGRANGLPLAAVVGPRTLMSALDHVFVSSTFGGETLSLAAAKATIQVYRTEPVIGYLWVRGGEFRNGFNRLAQELGAPLWCEGSAVHPKIACQTPALMDRWLAATAQRGQLFHRAGFNISYAHTKQTITETLDVCRLVMRELLAQA